MPFGTSTSSWRVCQFHHRNKYGVLAGIRTRNLPVKSRLLYQLSYKHMKPRCVASRHRHSVICTKAIVVRGMAGQPGLEPGKLVLETRVLPILDY